LFAAKDERVITERHMLSLGDQRFAAALRNWIPDGQRRENHPMSATNATAMHLRWQAEWCTKLGSPLYGSLLGRSADDVEAGGAVARLLGDREASSRSMLGLKLLGAVHRLVLEGRASQLAEFYPSVGGAADPDAAWEAFRELISKRPQEIEPGLKRPVQTNEVGRAAALVGGFLEVARATGLPLRILEVGASAGLHLRWDHYFYEARGRTWGPADSRVRICSFNSDCPLPFDVDAYVAERRGCDTNPVDPTTSDGRLTLLSYVWPDQLARHRLLRAALEIAQQVPAEVETAGLIEWVDKNALPTAGVATVVYHSIVMQYLSEEDRLAFERLLLERGDATTAAAPLAWLRMEPGGSESEVRLRMWPGGMERLVATSGYHGQNVRWLA
jgi:hypothetical protein